jgi:hypothetical protein
MLTCRLEEAGSIKARGRDLELDGGNSIPKNSPVFAIEKGL